MPSGPQSPPVRAVNQNLSEFCLQQTKNYSTGSEASSLARWRRIISGPVAQRIIRAPGDPAQRNRDGAETSICRMRRGVIAEQVLGAKVVRHLFEGLFELGRFRVIVLAAGLLRQRDQRMLAPGIAA